MSAFDGMGTAIGVIEDLLEPIALAVYLALSWPMGGIVQTNPNWPPDPPDPPATHECAPLDKMGRSCDYADDTEECQERLADGKPCEFNIGAIMRMMDLAEGKPDPKGTYVLMAQEWVRSDQPTAHGRAWMKLRLQVAESEVAPAFAADAATSDKPPTRVRARSYGGPPSATAWGPGRILAALEAHVRTFAAVPANIIQCVRDGR